jgi:hypothetical protein
VERQEHHHLLDEVAIKDILCCPLLALQAVLGANRLLLRVCTGSCRAEKLTLRKIEEHDFVMFWMLD